MTLSMILAWLAVLLVILTAYKYIARIRKSVISNRFFHKIHIPLGIAAVFIGLMHGLLAGNTAGTGLTEAYIGTVILSLNWGTLCLIVLIFLWGSYILHPVLKKKWMKIHRVLTVCLLAVLILHIQEVDN